MMKNWGVGKLPPAFKEMWIKAMEEKCYKYAEGTLHKIQGTEHAYCALGVAAKIATGEDYSGAFITNNDPRIPDAIKGKVGHALAIARSNDTCKSYDEAIKYIRENM